MRKYVKNYVEALGEMIKESDPERDVRVYGLGMLRVRKHEGHPGMNIDSGESMRVPAYRTIKLDPAPRIDYVLKAPLKDFYDIDAP